MRVLSIQPFLSGYAINPHAGGKNKAALRLAQYLAAHGHEIFVLPWSEHIVDERPFWLVNGAYCATVLPTVMSPSIRNLIGRLPSLAGSRYLPLHPVRRINTWLKQSLFDRKHVLIRAMDRAKPDVVHVHHTQSDFPLIYRRLGYNRPLILHHTHGIGLNLDHYDQIVFPSRYQQNKICDICPGVKSFSRVIYYPVDDNYRRKDIGGGNGDIVFMGILHADERKGLDILLKAYMDDTSLNQWQLTIIGEGTMRIVYEQMINGRNLNIRFAGRVSDEANATLMQEARLFVLPSREESFGIVYAEALCMGLPVLGYPPSIRELSALLGMPVGMPFDATTNDHGHLAKLIKQMMKPGNQFDRNVRAEFAHRARRTFSLEKFGSEYETCYREVFAGVSDTQDNRHSGKKRSSNVKT